jgi:hypothetical protein
MACRLPSGCLSERGRRPSIGYAECVIEAAHAFESGRKGNLRQRHRGFVEQALRALNPTGRRDLARGRTGMAEKKPQKVPRADPESLGKPID